ncbi:MAG TPA: chemotaxis protein CheA [Ohtaekwangia sp.]|uniref:chemotaxis protein CheA n=1 Tax=Ohtaekwangia sp. TaxID=2066019 RepID=UPI002F9311F7
MDSNQKRFVEDALDLLNELDEGLLQLEANPNASAPLEQVFRTMHTIKGGANMFGFENIGALAHQLETLYDRVRQGQMQVSDELISITLQAFDKVRDLLKEKDVARIAHPEALKDHLNAAANFLKTAEAKSAGVMMVDSSIGAVQKDELATFFLRVTPTINITEDGNHPLVFIIQDIAALGTSRVLLTKHDAGHVVHWEVFVTTTAPQTELESYFLFVENECTVYYHKLTPCDLFEQPGFAQYIDTLGGHPVELEKLAPFIAQCLEVYEQQKDVDTGVAAGAAGGRRVANDSYIKVSKRKVDDLLNWISELIILQAQLTTTASAIQHTSLTEVAEQLEMITGRLRDTSLEIGLVPIETLVTKFKRLVRDLSRQLNKKVNFLSEGADTEMDKDVIEMMTDPIIHIIRNAIDHGIEAPEIRKAAGKSEHGTIKLKAFNSSSYVNIVISDDGQGIHKDRVVKKALERGLIAADAILTDDEIYALIFHPGLSTASQISDVSGRGVGMDVVKQQILELRGSVHVKSEPGAGTAIHIKLPLSRSIIEGLLVNVADTRYVVPLNIVERIDRIPYHELEREDKLNKMVLVNEEPLQVLSLRKKFHDDTHAPKTTDIISVQVNGIRKGIAVDKIEGKMQTVMKPLGDAYRQQDFVSGSTILGNGSLALVLDPLRLFQITNY